MIIEKITNIGLRASGSQYSIPCIRVVVSDYAGTTTAEEMRQLYERIYESSMGAVTAVASWAYGDPLTTDFIPSPDGTYDVGDDNGFKYSYTISTRVTSPIQTEQTENGMLTYLGVPVSRTYVYTGYSRYEVGYLVIFTDSNYNLLLRQGGATFGFQIQSDGALGVNIRLGIPVCMVTRGDFSARPDDTTIYETGINIKDHISHELDIDNDPYAPGDTTGDDDTGGTGGTGTFTDNEDPIDIPPLPTLSAADTGFITLFAPSVSQLQNLANYMWSGPFDLDTYKKIFADPMDCILGLSIVPVAVPSGGTSAVTVGNISTGVSMTKASAQYVEVDCGTINIKEFWGAYLDYDPYTKTEIYLPYIGTHALATDDVMNKSVHVVYHIDILSGACTAFVKCGNSVLYTFIGQCSSSIPITGNDFTNVVNGILQIAGSIGTLVATGGTSAPMNVATATAAAAPIAATAVNYLKPNVEKSGAMSGTGGMMAVQKPYLIVTRPRQALPEYQNKMIGYPSFITRTLSSVFGYTEIENIHLENVPATDAELLEIKNLLREGAIF